MYLLCEKCCLQQSHVVFSLPLYFVVGGGLDFKGLSLGYVPDCSVLQQSMKVV